MKNKRKRKSWLEMASGLAGLGGLMLFLEMWKELHEFDVRRYRIHLTQNTSAGEEVKLVFLSDLHGNCYGRENRELIQAIREEAPDYILIGGDLLTRENRESDQTAVNLMKQLAGICPVYLANGNHEQKMRIDPEKYENRYEKYKETLEELGVHILENCSEHCDMKGLPVTISGVEIPLECYGHFHARELLESDMESRIGKPEQNRYQILLAHSPVYFDTYARWGADLTLSGHLHGGMVNLPGLGALITPQAKLFPKYYGGIYRKGDKVSVVSRGLGTHTVNVRLFNPAELVVVTLCPGKTLPEEA